MQVKACIGYHCDHPVCCACLSGPSVAPAASFASSVRRSEVCGVGMGHDKKQCLVPKGGSDAHSSARS